MVKDLHIIGLTTMEVLIIITEHLLYQVAFLTRIIVDLQTLVDVHQEPDVLLNRIVPITLPF